MKKAGSEVALSTLVCKIFLELALDHAAASLVEGKGFDLLEDIVFLSSQQFSHVSGQLVGHPSLSCLMG